MLSPDGKWVWDGAQWQPIARRDSVFPSWQSIAVEPAASVPAPIATPVPTPAINQPMNPLLFPQTAEASTAIWKRGPKATSLNNYLYFAAGLVGIVIIVVVLNSVVPLWLLLPGPKPPPALPSPKASPLPALTQRTDSARAERFSTVIFSGATDTLVPALVATLQQCSKQLTNSCESALTASKPEITNTLEVIDKNPVPLCIAAPTARVRADIAGIDTQTQAALKAYSDNQGSELSGAMHTYGAYWSALIRDVSSLNTAAKNSCDTQETGP